MRRHEKKAFIRAFQAAQTALMRSYASNRDKNPRYAAVLHYIASKMIPSEIKRIDQDKPVKDDE